MNTEMSTPGAHRQDNFVTLEERATDLAAATKAARHLLRRGEYLVQQEDERYLVVRGRSGRIASLALDGVFYSEIGRKEGVSGERARQIAMDFFSKDGERLRKEALRHRRLMERRGQVTAYAKQHPMASIPQITREVGHGLTSEEIMTILGEEETSRRPMRASSGRGRQFTDKECLDALRAVAGDSKTLSVKRYQDSHGGKPSPMVLIHRFGSWKDACKAAGIEPAEARRDSWVSKWDKPSGLKRWLREFFEEYGPTGTSTQYDKWSRGVPERPSLATLRNRLGPWSTLRSLLQEDDAVTDKRAEDMAAAGAR